MSSVLCLRAPKKDVGELESMPAQARILSWLRFQQEEVGWQRVNWHQGWTSGRGFARDGDRRVMAASSRLIIIENKVIIMIL